MFEHYNWAYLLGDLLVGFPIWLILFYIRKDLQREMLIAGLLLGIISMLCEHVFWKDYWHPESFNLIRTQLGDFGYGFFFGGIASVIYEILSKKYLSRKKNKEYHWSWFVFPALVFLSVVFYVPSHFGVNSIYSACIAMFLLTIFMITLRHDLFLDALVSGVLFGIITLFSYIVFLKIFPGIINAWFNLASLSGVLVFNIPVEELFFAFCLGLSAGPAYEFFTGTQFIKKR